MIKAATRIKGGYFLKRLPKVRWGVTILCRCLFSRAAG